MNPEMREPQSCDTFVALPPATSNDCVIFGKNSDRPASEVQEVVCFPAANYPAGTQLKCTYIEIPQVEHTYAVVLSKPAWIWGAEMGSNEHGVCIGNEAVWTRFTLETENRTESLLGMDYLRLALERAKTAREAVDVITSLLPKYGQYGRCFEDPDWAGVIYCNSYLMCDRTEAWVLETAGVNWAAERVTSGVRNISNVLSIGDRIDLMSDGLVELAARNGWWDVKKDGPLNFTRAFILDRGAQVAALTTGRFKAGKDLLEKLSKDGKFDVWSMFQICRDTDSCICMTGPVSATVGVQVSCIPRDPTKTIVHWFNATPNPLKSIFKPFVFSQTIKPCPLTTSPDFGAKDPARVKPRFARKVNRSHLLHSKHAKILHPLDASKDTTQIVQKLMELEKNTVDGIDRILESGRNDLLFWDAVDAEMKIYDDFERAAAEAAAAAAAAGGAAPKQ